MVWGDGVTCGLGLEPTPERGLRAERGLLPPDRIQAEARSNDMKENLNFGAELNKLKKIVYGDFWFSPFCPICGDEVECDSFIRLGAGGWTIEGENATCEMHGRVRMPFAGKFVRKEQ